MKESKFSLKLAQFQASTYQHQQQQQERICSMVKMKQIPKSTHTKCGFIIEDRVQNYELAPINKHRQQQQNIYTPNSCENPINCKKTANNNRKMRPKIETIRKSRAHSKSRFALVFYVICIALAALSYLGFGWPQQVAASAATPNTINGLQQSIAQLLQVFNGNESQPFELNNFKVMERYGDFILLGAR